MKPAALTATLALLLTACSTSAGSLNDYLSGRKIPLPNADSFASCRNYGCHNIDLIELSEKQWKSIDRIFTRKPAKSPEAEREKIAKAIAVFETYVGDINGTHEDVGGTFDKTGPFQQDCVDESTNTSIYIATLEQRKRLKFHTILAPTTRIPLIHAGTWPHQGARIMDSENGEIYIVDSWFHDNGKQPEIIPIKDWKAGWKPEDGNEEKENGARGEN